MKTVRVIETYHSLLLNSYSCHRKTFFLFYTFKWTHELTKTLKKCERTLLDNDVTSHVASTARGFLSSLLTILPPHRSQPCLGTVSGGHSRPAHAHMSEDVLRHALSVLTCATGRLTGPRAISSAQANAGPYKTMSCPARHTACSVEHSSARAAHK